MLNTGNHTHVENQTRNSYENSSPTGSSAGIETTPLRCRCNAVNIKLKVEAVADSTVQFLLYKKNSGLKGNTLSDFTKLRVFS